MQGILFVYMIVPVLDWNMQEVISRIKDMLVLSVLRLSWLRENNIPDHQITRHHHKTTLKPVYKDHPSV